VVNPPAGGSHKSVESRVKSPDFIIFNRCESTNLMRLPAGRQESTNKIQKQKDD